MVATTAFDTGLLELVDDLVAVVLALAVVVLAALAVVVLMADAALTVTTGSVNAFTSPGVGVVSGVTPSGLDEPNK